MVIFFRVLSEFEFPIVQTKRSNVVIVVSPKIKEIYVGRFSIIFYLGYVVKCRFAMTANEKGLWSGGVFETPLPERQPM